MFVAEIHDKCLLGADFFKATNSEKIFENIFGISEENRLRKFSCSRMESFQSKLPDFLEIFLQENSEGINSFKKEIFTKFLIEFQDVFSKDIFAGSCGLVKHKINLNNVNPIKQAPRRIPFALRGEVYKIIEEMKEQGVIEESKSSWVSPAVLVKKKRWYD